MQTSSPVIVVVMGEAKKPRTETQAQKTAARNPPRWTTVLLLVGSVVSIGVAVAGVYLVDQIADSFFPFKSQLVDRVVLVARIIRVIAIILAVVFSVAFLYRLIRVGYRYEWTGFGEADLPKPENREVRPEKTVWDWMQLLIVPVVLAIVTIVFTLYQEGRLSRIEQQRAQAALQVAEERARAAELQDYLDQMGSLLLNKDRPLRQSKKGDEVRSIARARTLTILERMNPSRKRQVIQFLYEADLIRGVEGSQPIMSLREVNLRRASLWGANLSEADLSGAHLEKADLPNADLSGADLSGAHLEKADLTRAHLSGANLSDADLGSADLLKTDLRGANLSGAFLWRTSLIETYLSRADLSGAGLWEADLNGAHLSSANLTNADLSGAYLGGAGLSDANLTDAQGATGKQLKQAKTLEGATMPDGSKHP
jgi:uncharacterized protein YjbI with pentapeptide repeats